MSYVGVLFNQHCLTGFSQMTLTANRLIQTRRKDHGRRKTRFTLQKMVGGTAISSKPSDSSSSDPFTLLSRTAISSFAEFPSILNKEGSSPEIGTVVYIHGIANKPVASVLKCQWDTALFGAPMGDRTRMAYWVDRDRYPEPEKAVARIRTRCWWMRVGRVCVR